MFERTRYENEYKIVSIPKGNGRYRTIYCVSSETRKRLREYLPYLEEALLKQELSVVNYGFVPGRNCALNALQHSGYRYTLSLDIENFFESVTPDHVKGIIDENVIDNCFEDGAPQQGFPTSPLIAMIAFIKSDRQIQNALSTFNFEHVYTRYADDIAVSFNDIRDVGKVMTIVEQVLSSNGFQLNKQKTKLQDSKNGRIIITGIGVDNEGLHATRKVKKKIRAAMHQQNFSSARGLVEWSKCKLPKKMMGDDYG